jgi:hypothetical protein
MLLVWQSQQKEISSLNNINYFACIKERTVITAKQEINSYFKRRFASSIKVLIILGTVDFD